MKKNVVLSALIMLMAVVTAAQAEINAGSFSVTPFIGGYVFEGNEHDFKNTYTVGLHAGYNFTKNIGIEGFFYDVPTEVTGVKGSIDANVILYGYGIEGLYNFMPDGRFVPFLAIGLGGIHYDLPVDGWNKFAVDYGAGLKVFLPKEVADFNFVDDMALRFDIRHVCPMNYQYNDLLVTFGITFSFGEKKKSVVITKVEEPVTIKEAVVVPKIEEPVIPKEAVVVPKIEEPVTPKETVVAITSPEVIDKNLVQVSSKQDKTKDLPEEAVQNLVNRWLNSWKSGDMKTYRNCYSSDFKSKGMNLDAWISYKTNMHQKSKKINVSIDNLQISVDGNNATAVFIQHYSSSIFKDSGEKILKLIKINDEWKIYKEIM